MGCLFNCLRLEDFLYAYLVELRFVVFYVFSFPAGVYVGTLNLIVSIPDPSILTLIMDVSLISSYTVNRL